MTTKHRLVASASIVPRIAAAVAPTALLSGACSSDGDAELAASTLPSTNASTSASTAPAEALPSSRVLTPDATTHLGLTWFSPPAPASLAAIGPRWSEAEAASSVGRVLVDWIDVEPEKGSYRFDELDEALGDIVDAGLAPMVTIAAVDVSGTEFPAWLGEFEPVAAGDAYVAMLEAALPTLRAHDVWLVSIANEPPFADDEELDRGDFATLVERVTAAMDELAPDVPVTFTFAGGDPFIDDPAIDRMRTAVDALSVNHYCLDEGLVIRPLAQATEQIDRYVEIADGRPIVFHEFGCPAGALNGSSDEDQLAWFEVALEHISSIEQIRAAFVFEFLDWSEETFELDYGAVTELLESEVGGDFVERFRSWRLTSGLVRGDGTTRPAFDHYLAVAGG